MHPILTDNLDSITELCQKYRVTRLDAFGSVLSDQFGPESDIDFLVHFHREGFQGAFTQFMGFKEELERTLQRRVELVNTRRIRNLVFEREVNSTKNNLYAA